MNDSMRELYEAGVITGKHKTSERGVMTASFALGTAELYHFLHHNPVVAFRAGSWVNDPYVIAKQHLMRSINTAVEIDVTGQVCSESVGHRELSGVGGAAETHIGAQMSRGGRGIIAMRSSAALADGSHVSKIAFELQRGAKVSVSRNDIDTVVTEYGVAALRGKSVAERVQALVAIAHPRFRDELLHQSREVGYL